MSHSRCLTYFAERKAEREKFFEEGVVKGTKDVIKDDFKETWRHVGRRHHTASKVALGTLAVVDSIAGVALLPVNVPLVALNILLFKANRKLNDDYPAQRRFTLS